jgi:hypothetical protein
MERCVSVRLRVAQLLVFGALTLAAHASAEDVAVVLVAGKDSPIEIISSLEIRKIYFGISVSVKGQAIRALRRRDDERLNQIFLQSVIAMSKRSYERRLLSLTLKFGTPRPVEVKSRGEVLKLLAENPSTITYMWKSEAEADPRVRIIRVLWQET